MAKESMKARELKRKKLVDKYASKRAQLKAEGDYIGLSRLPAYMLVTFSTWAC